MKHKLVGNVFVSVYDGQVTISDISDLKAESEDGEDNSKTIDFKDWDEIVKLVITERFRPREDDND